MGQEGLNTTPSWDKAPGRDPGGQEELCEMEGETRREGFARRLSQTLSEKSSCESSENQV